MNRQKNGRYPVEFRLWAVEQLKAGIPVGTLAKQIGVHRVNLYLWKKNPFHPASKRKNPPSPKPSLELSLQEELQQVKQALAEKVLELDFLKGALQRVEARRQRSTNSGETTSTDKSGQ